MVHLRAQNLSCLSAAERSQDMHHHYAAHAVLLPVCHGLPTAFVAAACTQVHTQSGSLGAVQRDNGAAGRRDVLCDLHVHAVQLPPAVLAGADKVLLRGAQHDDAAGGWAVVDKVACMQCDAQATGGFGSLLC